MIILHGITIVTSAFLLFLVQPIIAKQILPWFGGSAAVWTTCVVFFQAVLLAGYAYAHGLTRRSPRAQAVLHIALLALSIAALPIIASSAWKPTPASDPTWRILGLLVATIGLPYFLLSSTGPLIQKWFADDRAANDLAVNDFAAARSASVYRLFALSNVGSLVGLLSYPFIVEPYATLKTQSWGWSAGYVLFALTCAACAWRVRGTVASGDASAPQATESGAAPGIARYAYWLACAALGSMLLLALTNHITQNIASIPFLWVLPLSLYLLSFVVVFEGRAGRGWYERRWWLAPTFAAVIAMAWALTAHRGVLGIYAAIPIYSVGLFLACVFCHGELATSKPAPAWLTQFYLCLSAGGAIGGLFVALVAPKLFDNYWETPLALVGLCALGLFVVRERRASAWLIGGALGAAAAALIFIAAGGDPFESIRELIPGHDSIAFIAVLSIAAGLIFIAAAWRRGPLAIAIAACACAGFYSWKYYRFLSEDTIYASRNFYGTLRVKQTDAGPLQQRRLLHGVILHGDQYTAPDKRRTPTTYYGPGSGIALALRELRPDHAPLAVAMIGLGTGTLTAWGNAGDRYRIYELNPAVLDVARRQFTYLSDSRAAITPVLGDARLAMERELDDDAADGGAVSFDVIAVDAFSSDSIPVHLITREALAVYLRHLKPDGVIAFHVSNRFLKLAPVVAQLADDAGVSAVDVIDDPDDEAYSGSEWVLVTRNDDFLDRDAVIEASTEIEDIPGLPIWTDQFNNLFKILK